MTAASSFEIPELMPATMNTLTKVVFNTYANKSHTA
jgi:hypothetical protein